jgi:glycosyltransferase involved in cell wall biosynthesis
MSQGVPVVGYNSGGIIEAVIHNKTGFLANEDEAFIRYTKEILLMDNKDWFDLQAESCNRAKDFSPENFIAGFNKYLTI